MNDKRYRVWLSFLFSGMLHAAAFCVLSYSPPADTAEGSASHEGGMKATLTYIPARNHERNEQTALVKKHSPLTVEKESGNTLSSEPVNHDTSPDNGLPETAGREGQETTINTTGTGKDIEPDPAEVFRGLYERIRKNTVYPRAARRRNLEGTVGISFTIDSDGDYLGCRITSKEGSSILERAAVSVIKSVLPYRHNLGKTVTLEVTITYSLEE
ncbi:MAG: energy transducer TonB [Spirochaetales bacterium]|nr:energy transducer TonB [Spirochaetales bacterium]